MRIPEGMNQMSQQSRWKRHIAERVRGSVGAVARRHYLSIAAVVLAVAACVALAPRALSNAAATPSATATAYPTPTATTTAAPTATNDEGVTWSPSGDLEQVDDGSGDCQIQSPGTFTGDNPTVIAEVDKVLDAMPDDDDGNPYYDETGMGPDGIAAPASGTTTGDSMVVQANVEVNCDLINQEDAYFKKTGYGSLDHFAHAVLDASRHPAAPGSRAVLLAYVALPAWLKNALSAIIGGVVYVFVAGIIAAAITAFAASLPPPGVGVTFAVSWAASLVGCVAGAAATAVSLLIAGASKSPFAVLGSVVGGCINGAIVANLPVVAMGKWVGAAIRPWVQTTIGSILGESAAQIATRIGVRTAPVQQGLQLVAAAFTRAGRP